MISIVSFEVVLIVFVVWAVLGPFCFCLSLVSVGFDWIPLGSLPYVAHHLLHALFEMDGLRWVSLETVFQVGPNFSRDRRWGEVEACFQLGRILNYNSLWG